MADVKVNKKELISAVKGREKPDKKNYTFRLATTTYEAFVRACENEGVGPTAVVEEFMRAFSKK